MSAQDDIWRCTSGRRSRCRPRSSAATPSRSPPPRSRRRARGRRRKSRSCAQRSASYGRKPGAWRVAASSNRRPVFWRGGSAALGKREAFSRRFAARRPQKNGRKPAPSSRAASAPRARAGRVAPGARRSRCARTPPCAGARWPARAPAPPRGARAPQERSSSFEERRRVVQHDLYESLTGATKAAVSGAAADAATAAAAAVAVLSWQWIDLNFQGL